MSRPKGFCFKAKYVTTIKEKSHMRYASTPTVQIAKTVNIVKTVNTLKAAKTLKTLKTPT